LTAVTIYAVLSWSHKCCPLQILFQLSESALSIIACSNSIFLVRNLNGISP
jgi:hypothetical protein